MKLPTLRPPKPPTEEDFTSEQRHEWLTARIGTALGIAFGLCFVTGLISHWYYLYDAWLVPPTRPVWGYRVTQGVHVLSGIAAIPLLLFKLWSVYPKLFATPPFGEVRALVLNLLERVSIATLVASSIFQLFTGVSNAAQWYPWSFSFRPTHYAVAWIAIGSLLVHVAVKLPIIREAYAAPLPEPAPPAVDEEGRFVDAADADRRHNPSRRAILVTALSASGIAVLASAGNTVTWLRKVSLFAVRDGEGPQGIPINRSAQAAGVLRERTGSTSFRLELRNGERSITLSRADLEQLPQRTHELPIACVEGWSANGRWTGVRLSELLVMVGASTDADVKVVSLQTRHAFGVTQIPSSFAHDPLTLLALQLNGEDLTLDHGYPCRLIAPNRPGVLQTKWVRRLEVLPT